MYLDRDTLQNIVDETRTLIFYESPHKLLKTLIQFSELFGADRTVAVSRELSKMFEETFRGKLSEAVDYFSAHHPKGEFVICVAGLQNK